MVEQDMELSISRIIQLLEDNLITFRMKQNRADVFDLYRVFYDIFNMQNSYEFLSDYYTLAADFYLYSKNFLKTGVVEDYDMYLKAKKQKELEKCLYMKEEDKDKYFYNLYQFVMNGFFFNGLPENGIIKVGLFTHHLTFDKAYKQAGYLLLMFNRYLGHMSKLEINIYISDVDNALEVKRYAEKRTFNLKKYEYNDEIKKYEALKSLGIGEQYYENIVIKYSNFNLKNKYNL